MGGPGHSKKENHLRGLCGAMGLAETHLDLRYQLQESVATPKWVRLVHGPQASESHRTYQLPVSHEGIAIPKLPQFYSITRCSKMNTLHANL